MVRARGCQKYNIVDQWTRSETKAHRTLLNTMTDRRRLADGTTKEYRYAAERPRHSREIPGSVGALLIAYRSSQHYATLRPATQRTYGYYLRHLEPIAHLPVQEVRRRTIIKMRDTVAKTHGPGAANVFVRVAASMFSWARDSDWLEASPVEKIRPLPGGHLAAWTREEADIAAANLPEPLRRAVVLARYTGQRRGDLVSLTWRAYDGSSIALRQQKTGTPLVIPAHPALKAELDAWKRDAASTHVLVSTTGRPWKPDNSPTSSAACSP
jgi:integrase